MIRQSGLTTIRPDECVQARIDASSLDRLSAKAALAPPPYDRAALPRSWAHLGFGAFHRCHQGDYLDDLARAGQGVAVTGINIRPPSIEDQFAGQGWLYTRTLRDGSNEDVRINGIVCEAIDAGHRAERALAALASPRTSIISLTITEKGYCHHPATGQLNEEHPDILHDVANGNAVPRSAPGWLALALSRRMASGAGPVSILSCDNIPANGALLERVVRRHVELTNPGLLSWLDANVSFPSAMVDRIVPATTLADIAAIARKHGFNDEAAVFGEPFRQWVIEDRFASVRPPLEVAGVEFVADVTGHEHIKMRVLNAAQSMFAILGCLAEIDFSHQSVRVPAFRTAVTEAIAAETFPFLDQVSGMDHAAYLRTSVSRIENTAIHHRNAQIATDTSQKIRQRILAPMEANLAAGLEGRRLAVMVGAWLALLLKTHDAGPRMAMIADPVFDELAQVVAAHGSNRVGAVGGLLRLRSVFGDLATRQPVACNRMIEAALLFLERDAETALELLNRSGPRAA
jgi:fructuronate reductase